MTHATSTVLYIQEVTRIFMREWYNTVLPLYVIINSLLLMG
jgi:hypothetical protein